ncbi:hypothetical protein BGZ65_011027 [Modicella reniformis]|uniref:Uncharacterized protein n=1 Tax=Modicella reniformis TaxID=1440133 RepID=A0A9P6J3P2_9FUNG|nr:hypothetical protein BGZ65_011027 [Modicella reniformis]
MEAPLSDTGLETSVSNTSLMPPTTFHPLRRASSPSLGPFKNLSSKLTVGALRRLSVSHKSPTNGTTGGGGQSSQEHTTQTQSGEHFCYCCCCNCGNHQQVTGSGYVFSEGGHSHCVNDGVGNNNNNNNNNNNKVKPPQGRFSYLRGVTSSRRNRKNYKGKKADRKSRDMDSSYLDSLVRQEFADYNYERQIEDFQRAARVFKEQNELTASAVTPMATEARTSVVDTRGSLKIPSHQQQQQRHNIKAFSSSSSSLVIIPLHETEEEQKTSSRELLHHSNGANCGEGVVNAGSHFKLAPEGLTGPLDDAYGSRRQPSNFNLNTQRTLNGIDLAEDHNKISIDTKTGRSIQSACNVDADPLQISACHRPHSGLARQSSIVASSHSRSQLMHPSCESIGEGAEGSISGGFNASTCGINDGGCDGMGPAMILENSPIQVVRATVSSVDDPSLPCFTFRMWILSTFFVAVGAATSEYSFFRSNPVHFSIYFVQLTSYFCGKAMARWLPTREFEIRIPGLSWITSKFGPSSLGAQDNTAKNSDHGADRSDHSRSNVTSVRNGKEQSSWRFTLNPGKFNMKEHMLIGVAAAAGCSPAYATNVIAIRSLVFNAPLSSLTGSGLVFSSQYIGFSMAWLLFDYVIKPSAMVWPATLVNVSLYNTLHEHKVLTRWFTRMQLFWYAFFIIFLYQWLPKMFMPILSSMALLCWINPSSNVLRKLGSGYTGLGIGSISLDWSIIYGVRPLYTPWNIHFYLCHSGRNATSSSA